jgi:hypothetical protein
MSYYQLGQLQNASNTLAISRNLANAKGGEGEWFDWTLDRILMTEAAALIEKTAPSSSSRPLPKEREALVRQQAEAREIVGKAAALASKNQMAEADRLIGKLPVSGDTATAGVQLFRALGDWAAVQGNWHRAAEYYSALVPSDQFETPLLATQDYIKYGVVLAEMNDQRTYENFCREYIKQFGDTANASLIERIVKSCSLLPPSASLLAALSPLAEKTAESARRGTDPNPWALPWQCMSLALFEYRHGNYAEAVNWGNRGLSFKQDSAMERVAATQAILAMSYHQLGQAEQARLALAKSRELVEQRWKTPFTVFNEDSTGWWYDWFLAGILEREAVAIIEPPAAAAKK